jgi:AraC-like DNA-binding protein
MNDALYQPFPLPGRARGQIWRYAPAFRRPRHFHDEPELNFVVAGTGKFGVGEFVVAVEGGDLIAWLPGQDHELIDASPDFDLFVVGLTPELSSRILGPRDGSTPPGPMQLRLSSDVVQRFTTTCAVHWENEDPTAAEARIGDLWRDAQALRASSRGLHSLSRRALGSLQERPDRRRYELSELIHGSRSELSRRFRADVGLTLTAYRTRLRILRFVKEVDHGDGNLLEAALASGFGSYSQCHRAFRDALGCSPRVFFGSDARDRMFESYAKPLAAPDADAIDGSLGSG